jgi:CheY-like chemotaxis protein
MKREKYRYTMSRTLITLYGFFAIGIIQQTKVPIMSVVLFRKTLCVYAKEGPPSSRSRQHKRIMIVDDERLITIAFKRGLEAEGFQVEAFNDPEEALSQYRAGNYVLIILDIRMPNIDGFHLARKIWQIDNEARICFLTAYAIYEDEAKRVFPKLRDYCFIQKPIGINDLSRRIKQRLYL